jgi:chromosome partitioning protein
MADTLITPLNDSFVDFDVLHLRVNRCQPPRGNGARSAAAAPAGRWRSDRLGDRAQLSTLGSRNKRLVGAGVEALSRQLGFRAIDGFAERGSIANISRGG